MKRRHLLSTAGLVALSPLVGADDPVRPSESDASVPDGDCGATTLSVSERLTADHGDPPVHYVDSRTTPSLVVQNERPDRVTVTVDIDQRDALTETYTLEPGERVVERSAVRVDWNVTSTVRIEGEGERRVAWPHQSAYRHGIALTLDGLEVGWIPPLDGVGDVQHDCYAGDEAPLQLVSLGDARTVTVDVVDLCTTAETTETVELGADGGESLSNVLTSGGLYDVTVAVEDGPTETYEYREECGGLEAAVDENGNLYIRPLLID